MQPIQKIMVKKCFVNAGKYCMMAAVMNAAAHDSI